MSKMALLVATLGAAASSAAAADEWVKHTVYRTTPINYTGLTNMDSGDAHGDVYFGLAQLVLPPLCDIDPGFLWCQNRKFLSDGAAHMVYTEFVVESRAAYGDYQPCNPDPTTGIFACDMGGGGSAGPPPPPQCNANGNQAYVEDGLNGTVYRTLQADEGACCTACSGDGAKCKGWAMPTPGSDECHLLMGPLVQWDDAKKKHGVRSGEHEEGGGGGGYSQSCWYADSDYNTTAAFVAVCDKSKCSCEAIERLSLGRELSAMCWHHGPSPPPTLALAGRRTAAPLPNGRRRSFLPVPGSPAALAVTAAAAAAPKATDPQWWTCSGAVYNSCYASLASGSASACEACVTAKQAVLAKAGCVDVVAAKGICHTVGNIDNNNVTCPAAVGAACPGLLHTGGEKTLACQDCAKASAAVGKNCSSWLVNDACYAGDNDQNEWREYMEKLACVMNGTWYSTQGAGECKPGSRAGPDCWWRIAETKRTVNQSCVDGRVVAAVRKARGDSCWQSCECRPPLPLFSWRRNHGRTSEKPCLLSPCAFGTTLTLR